MAGTRVPRLSSAALRSVVIAALLALPASAATPRRHLLSVNLKSEGDGPWFAILTDSPANFTSFKLRHPARVVVDFPETSAAAAKSAGPAGGLVAGWNIQNLGTPEQVIARLTVELRSDADYTLSSEGSSVELHLVPATARPLVAIESERVAQQDPPAAVSAPADFPLSLPEPAPATPPPAVPAPVVAAAPVQEPTPGLKSDAPHAAAADTDLVDEKTRKARQSEEAKALAEQQAAKDREAAEQQAAKEREAAEQRERAERKAVAEREATEQRERAERKAAAEHEAAEQHALAERKAAAEHEAAEQRALVERKAAAEHEAAERREATRRQAIAAREAAAAQARQLAEHKAHEAEVRRQQLAEERARRVAEKKASEELAARQAQERRAARVAAAQARQERLAEAKRDRLAARGRLATLLERRASPAVLGQIGFHASEGGPEVIIHTSSPVTYAMREASAERLFLELDRTGITVANNRRPLETRFFGTAVERIVPHEDRAQQHVSVEIDLATPAPYDIQAEGTTLRVRFHALPVKTAVAGGPDPTPEP